MLCGKRVVVHRLYSYSQLYSHFSFSLSTCFLSLYLHLGVLFCCYLCTRFSTLSVKDEWTLNFAHLSPPLLFDFGFFHCFYSPILRVLPHASHLFHASFFFAYVFRYNFSMSLLLILYAVLRKGKNKRHRILVLQVFMLRGYLFRHDQYGSTFHGAWTECLLSDVRHYYYSPYSPICPNQTHRSHSPTTERVRLIHPHIFVNKEE